MPYTKKELWDHHINCLDNHRREVERLEKQLRIANEQLSTLAFILSDKAEDAARLFPDYSAATK